MKPTIAFLMAALVLGAPLTHGQQSPTANATSTTALTDGEVRKVDKDAQKLTLRHGPIANLDMPSMTMVFRVSDPAMLDNVQVGDKVRFHVEKVGGQLTVTRLEPRNG
jgi:Cu/Ag efflux protein CusF